jgi:hypothetical protein
VTEIAVVALFAGLFLALSHRRFGWRGYAILSAGYILSAPLLTAFLATPRPPATTPAPLPWLCHALPLPLAITGTVICLGLLQLLLRPARWPIGLHAAFGGLVAAVGMVCFTILLTAGRAMGALGCSTV